MTVHFNLRRLFVILSGPFVILSRLFVILSGLFVILSVSDCLRPLAGRIYIY